MIESIDMKPSYNNPTFNADTHVKELNERFARLVKNLGVSNKKGTDRYKFEVNFAYALNEILICPKYMQGKMFDVAAGIVSQLINHLKVIKAPFEQAA